MEDAPSAIDDYLLHLAKRDKPRICLIPTASGDLPEHIDKFYAAFPSDRCVPTHLAFFRKPVSGNVPSSAFEARILAQDIIFVGGGNTKSALAVWREWRLDTALKAALGAGVVLSGMSAGAMCWFEQGLTDSFWGSDYRTLACLGFLPGGCGVHYSSDETRRSALYAAIEARAILPSVAIDDYAAVLYSDGKVSQVVSWRDSATAYRVFLENGRAKEVGYAAERI
jgi:dipeptidase E